MTVHLCYSHWVKYQQDCYEFSHKNQSYDRIHFNWQYDFDCNNEMLLEVIVTNLTEDTDIEMLHSEEKSHS